MLAEGAKVFLSSRRENVLKEAVGSLNAPNQAGYSAGDAAVPADVERDGTAYWAMLADLRRV